MQNNGILKLVLAASLVLNVTMLGTAGYRAYRQPAWISPFGREMTRNQFLFEELSLKPEQLKALKERTMPFRAEIDRQRRDIDAKRRELVSQMRPEKPDPKAMNSAIAGISRMQEQMQRRITAHMIEIKASLDKDNQQKFMDLIEKRMSGGVEPGCPPDAHAR